MFSGLYSFFSSTTQPARESLVFDDKDCGIMNTVEENSPASCSENANQIYVALQNNGYKSYPQKSTAKTQSLRLMQPSQIAGSILHGKKQIDFQAANYHIVIDKLGNVRYQIEINSSYYPIAIENIPDATIKDIHTKVVAPLLPKEPENNFRIKR